MSPSERVEHRPTVLGEWEMRTTVERALYWVREDGERVVKATAMPDGRGGWRWEVSGSGVSGEVATASGAKEAADTELREMGYALTG